MVSWKNKLMNKLFLFLLLILNSFLYTSSIQKNKISLEKVKKNIKSFFDDTLPCSKMIKKKECENLCMTLLKKKYNVKNSKIVTKISKKIADLYFRKTPSLAKKFLRNKNSMLRGIERSHTLGGRNGGDDVNEESDWWNELLSAICFFC